MNAALDPLAAQLLLRAYARATNMLIAGRSFATDDPTLTALLRAFGAHVRPLSDAEGTPASPPVVFALEEDAAPTPGAITVLAPGGVFRAVVACKSINYDLMSEPERDGIEYGYKGVLNSLEFPIQILVRSQRIDIAPYLERLADIRRNNDNMLLGVLMDDYINFIDQVSQEANIMDKSFFVVAPTSAIAPNVPAVMKNVLAMEAI